MRANPFKVLGLLRATYACPGLVHDVRIFLMSITLAFGVSLSTLGSPPHYESSEGIR